MLKSSLAIALTLFGLTANSALAASDHDAGVWEVFNVPGKQVESRICPSKDLVFSCFGAYCKDGALTTFVTNLGFKHEEARGADLGKVTVVLSANGHHIGSFSAERIIPDDKGYAQIDFIGPTTDVIRKAWKEHGGTLTASLSNGQSTEFGSKYADFSLKAVMTNCP